MHYIDKETLEHIRKEYPIGTRVELIKMDDPYTTKLVPGCKGTVRYVDDIGTIHISCRLRRIFIFCFMPLHHILC